MELGEMAICSAPTRPMLRSSVGARSEVVGFAWASKLMGVQVLYDVISTLRTYLLGTQTSP
eukprot:m.63005 g.63005  ORF g.63005 m.63005 type:complete len:61 (+) comp13944_c0_seq4:1408-1590(+)